MKKQRRVLRLLFAALLGVLLEMGSGNYLSIDDAASAQAAVQQRQSQQMEKQAVEQQAAQARQLYINGQFLEAIAQWQAIAQTYAAQQNTLAQASALSNLSLSYQQIGQWDSARGAIEQSLALIQSTTNNSQSQSQQWAVLAQALMTQGRLKMSVGQPEQALAIWQQATEAYQKNNNTIGQSRAQINQAQALRELGFYRQALEKLTTVTATIDPQPPSLVKAIALRRLGEALRLNGQLSEAQTTLLQSLVIAIQLESPSETSATLSSLGHTARAIGENDAAETFYARAIAALGPNASARQSVPIQLAQLQLYVKTQKWTLATELLPAIQSQFDELPLSRKAIFYAINWANSSIKIIQAKAHTDISAAGSKPVAQQLKQTIEQARRLSDISAESYALGTLGQLYEQNQQWGEAQVLTQKALSLSLAGNDAEISYRWQWQTGRLWQHSNNPKRSIPNALEAYSQAVATLSQLRGDLSKANNTMQFSFSEDVEPVYREFVSLLVQTDDLSPDYQKNLAIAQNTIESLRLAELDNYFQEACIDVQPVDISQVDPKAAIIYTLVLDDHLSVILKLPNQPLQHFSTDVGAHEVGKLAKQIRQQLVIRSRRQYFEPAKRMYDWLIAPAREAIERSGVKTLVFVLDGPLQSIPMAALYDGDRFLIEDYAVGLTSGLKLINPQPWQRSNLKALIVGLTESRQGLVPLPYVAQEVEQIKANVRSNNLLLNQNFTYKALSRKLKSSLYPIVHIATHGRFGSTPEETYLVAWDERINVREVNQMLQANLGSRQGIELLVLSACETASGDQKAALGLAGVAIKAGARSTLGSLWAIQDEATAEFAGQFYQQLAQPEATRAGALRKAQLKLLKDPEYKHPIYWAPYVLLGSWM